MANATHIGQQVFLLDVIYVALCEIFVLCIFVIRKQVVDLYGSNWH